jgi:RNA polymerase sigma-70 factor (ECF subfamily)
VYRLMVHMVGVEDAEDLTQQTFLRLFLKLDHFAGRSQFDTWLYRLSFNEALQFLRKARRSRYFPLTHDPMSPPQSHKRYDDQELLEQALAQLDPDLRSIFVLREIEELSYIQIAEALDIPEGTVGSRLNRARAELQRHLIRLGWEQ